MKRMKKIAGILLAMVMVLGMNLNVFAGSITINGSKGTGTEETIVSVANKTFTAYQILTAELANGINADGGVIYKVPAVLEDFYVTYFSGKGVSLDPAKASFNEDVTKAISDLTAEGIKDFTENVLAAAKSTAGIISKTVSAGENDTEVTIDGLDLGYYVVEDKGTGTPVSALALTTTVPDASINIKASRPVIDKKIDGVNDTDDATTGEAETNTASIGDKVPYVVTATIPDMSGYEKYYFIVNDTMSKGLTFNDDIEIVIKGGTTKEDGTKEDKTLTKDTDYTVDAVKDETTGVTAIEIVFKNFIQYRGEAEITETEGVPVVTYPDSLAGSEIVITYSATLNKDAVIGAAGNPNEVKLTYSNNPNEDLNGDPENPDKPTADSPVGESGKKETRTYVTGIVLTKVDDKGNILAGAEFQIEGTKQNIVLVSEVSFVEAENGAYWLLKDGKYTTTAPVADTVDEEGNVTVQGTAHLYDEAGKKYNKVVTEDVDKKETETVKVSAVVDASTGKLTFEGLAAGVYTITEVKAPNGYNMLKNPITVKIECETPEKIEVDVDSDSIVNNCKWTAVYTLNGLNETQLGLMKNNTIAKLKEENLLGTDVVLADLMLDTELPLFDMSVENKSGALLPSTGGIGTTIFYVAGGILVLAAVVLLVTKKRMSKEK